MGSKGSKPFAESAREVINRRNTAKLSPVSSSLLSSPQPPPPAPTATPPATAAKASAGGRDTADDVLKSILISSNESTTKIQSHIPAINKAESMSSNLAVSNTTADEAAIDPNILKEMEKVCVHVTRH